MERLVLFFGSIFIGITCGEKLPDKIEIKVGNNSNSTHIEINWDQPTIVQSGYSNLTAIIVKVEYYPIDFDLVPDYRFVKRGS
jgi:hypothetical protein